MTRLLCLVVIPLVLVAPVLADDSREPRPVATGEGVSASIGDSEPLAGDQELAILQDAPATSPQGQSSGNDIKFVTDSAADYYQVRECDCDLEHLGSWCQDCRCGCTTDEWFAHPCLPEQRGTRRRLADGTWVANDIFTDISGPPNSYYDSAVRFGYWAVGSNGSTTKTGEYQSLKSSPFWDIDSIMSSNNRTLDLVLSGLDQEANDARVRYYMPGFAANVHYQRYWRMLDHDPLPVPLGPPYPPNDPPAPGSQNFADVVGTDLNVGQDYAIRVQQLDARFKGAITDNVSWKLNVWGMRKFGERQANAVAHCFNVKANALPADTRCHLLSQSQHIDWTTLDILPAVEARFEGFTVEYSHLIRSFVQNDQLVDRQYTRFGYQQPPAGTAQNGLLGPDFYYGFVPESVTHIDRVKVNADLNENNKFYGNMYYGQVTNEFRNTHRQMRGIDLRMTNDAIDRVTLTAYGSMYDENNQWPAFYFNSAPYGLGESASTVDHPVNYNRTRFGLKGVWKPYEDDGLCMDCYDPWNSLRIVSGYEYYMIARDYATYSSTRLGTFTQPDTKINQVELGPQWDWTPQLFSYVRYRGIFAEDPLIGVRESQGRFNTNQPEQQHGVEFGGRWSPTDTLMATASIGIMNSWNHSFYASNAVGNRPITFSEQSYPLVFTLWHAPTEKLSLTAAYSYLNNFVNQDITVGFRGPDTPGSPFETTQWNYQGTNHLISLSGNYAVTPDFHLIGGAEWNAGINGFGVPPMTDTVVPSGSPNWTQLPSFSAVHAITMRVTGGIDWQPYRNVTVYTRYIYFSYDDVAQGVDSGTAQTALAGASVVW